MSAKLFAVVFLATTAICGLAQADNTLSTDQLMKSLQNSVKDYVSMQPDMAKAISGMRTKTVGNTAQVTIEMNTGGMSMSAKYSCAPQGDDMACMMQQ